MLQCCSIFLLTIGCACAQGTLTGPSLGFVFDEKERAVRPIWGIPGASTVGAPLNLSFAIAEAFVSPSQDYVLAHAARGPLNLISLGPNGPSTSALSSAVTVPDRIVFSPGGKAAALVHQSTNTVQIITGLPQSSNAAVQMDLSALPQPPDAIAVSDDGSVLLAGVSENANGQTPTGEVFVVTGPGGARSIAHVRHASALAFLSQSHDALIADNVNNSIQLVRDAAGAASAVWSFTDAGLPAPDSVQASSGNQRIFAASSTHNVVAILDASGVNATFIPCQCAPTEMHALSVASVYQITEAANGLLWILDGSASQPRVLFVPVPVGTTNPNAPHEHEHRRHQ